MNEINIAKNAEQIRERIFRHAVASGRDPSDIRIICVTKNVDIERIKAALKCGMTEFAENYAQEFRDKYRHLQGYNDKLRWHYIGRLQKNKIKYLTGKVIMIHSVDSVDLAEEINKRYAREKLISDVLIEVNIAQEENKGGVAISESEAFVAETAKMKNLKVRGFMTMAPYYDNSEDARPFFRELRSLRDSISRSFSDVKELSMGMSNDFHIAVEEGATMVRLGSSLFGTRNYSNTKKGEDII